MEEERLTQIKEDNTYIYGNAEKLVNLSNPEYKFLPKEFYRQVVESLPIVCLDIIAEDANSKEILLIKRTQQPLKGTMFFSGGRLIRGETFFSGAVRKVQEETGMKAEPQGVLGVVNTFFEMSEWDTNNGTQTINVLVYVLVQKDEGVKLNELHSNYDWVPKEKILQDQSALMYNQYVIDGLKLLEKWKKLLLRLDRHDFFSLLDLSEAQ